MESLDHVTRRLVWTRAWLKDFKSSRPTLNDGFEHIDSTECISENDSTASDEDSFVLVDTKPGQAAETFVLPADVKPRTRSKITTSELAYWEGLRFGLLSYDDRPASFTTEEWRRFDFESLLDEQREILFGIATRKDAIDYEIAGRSIENAFQDMRSNHKARERDRKISEKYHRFQHVNLGQIGELHFMSEGESMGKNFMTPVPDAKIVELGPKDLYKEAQRLWKGPICYPARPRRRSNPSKPQNSSLKMDSRDLQEAVEELDYEKGPGTWDEWLNYAVMRQWATRRQLEKQGKEKEKISRDRCVYWRKRSEQRQLERSKIKHSDLPT